MRGRPPNSITKLPFPVLFQAVMVGFIVTGYLFLFTLSNFRLAVPEMLGITAIQTILLTLVLYVDRKWMVPISPIVILLLALCFRMLFVFHSPQLSDDIYRYLFDGRQLLSGRNPYSLSPLDAVSRDPGMSDLVARVNHPDLVTIYPPGAQLVFAGGALSGGLIGMKLTIAGLDLILVLLILKMLKMSGLSASRAILYAWHPLTMLEISASGHIDGAGICFIFIALFLISDRPADVRNSRIPFYFYSPCLALNIRSKIRCLFGGIFFSFGVLVKLFPIVFFPSFWRMLSEGEKKWFAGGSLAAALLLILSFYPSIKHSFHTLSVYTEHWEFSGFLFRSIRDALNSGKMARVILGSAFVFFMYWRYRAVSAVKVPSPMTPYSLLSELKTALTVSFCFLLFTPTLHPWYALYLVSFLPFSPGIAGIILSWSVLLGYRVLIAYGILNQWVEDSLTPLMIWVGPAAAVVILKISESKRFKSEHV